MTMKLNHPALAELLQRAYSAEKAAAFAYIGHAASLKKPADKAAVKQIEDDEWGQLGKQCLKNGDYFLRVCHGNKYQKLIEKPGNFQRGFGCSNFI
ncbi:MAG TPA: hypothetical protein VG347_17035 [Verrucomicrobiae bacterium]|nr:hypothetical protein [Verrucomicrobiae bacterium]